MATIRRRGAELEQALHAATIAELEEHGYDGMTFEGVAERAGTSKPVLYRRWSRKADMVMSAFAETFSTKASSLGELPDTGDLIGDLAAPLRMVRGLFSPAERRMMMMVLANLDAEATEPIRTMLFARVERLVAPIVERARTRGELGDTPIPSEILNLPFDLARHDVFMRGELSDARIEVIVSEITAPLWISSSRA